MHDKTEEYYDKAIEIIYSSYGHKHLYTEKVLNSYADYNLQCGKYEKTTKLANKVLAIEEKVYGANHHLLAYVWVTLAGINITI